MRIIRRRGWEIAESQVTPESVALNRRAVMGGTAALLAAGPAMADPNPKYEAGRALTDEKSATTYNNYYEFSESKNLWRAAQAMKTSPWTIEIAGLVKQPRKIAYEDLLKQVSLQERIYRHRCVEAWAMTVPWTGFPMTDLLKLAEPLGSETVIHGRLTDGTASSTITSSPPPCCTCSGRTPMIILRPSPPGRGPSANAIIGPISSFAARPPSARIAG